MFLNPLNTKKIKKYKSLHNHMNHKPFKKICVLLVIVLFFGAFLGTLTHELIGHGVTTILLGVKITEICVLFFKINQEGSSFTSCLSNNGFFGGLTIKFEESTPINYWFVAIMGSLSTFLVSILFSFILLFKKKLTGYLKQILIVFSLYFVDLLYGFFKILFKSGDFFYISTKLEISLIPLILITFFGAFTTITILFYKLKNKEISNCLKIIFSSLLFLILISLFAFMAYSRFEIYNIWY